MHIITIRKLTKIYKLGQTHTNLLSEKIGNKIYALYRKLRNSDVTENKTDKYQKSDKLENTIYALKNVSFKVQQGEVIGIIGSNGAGKSTLLKILSRITTPTAGTVEMYGRVTSLLEIGTGFHAELTGRENIFLNGSILGMKRFEIKKKFDEIIDFAEISAFVDTPVKRYSSGMYIRLAFAVAAHLESDILIVDEVLAVGDVKFQKKCLGKMEDVAKKGRTVLLVTHNMASVAALCERGIVLDNGNLIYNGSIDRAIAIYMGENESADCGSLHLSDIPKSHRQGNGLITITKIDFFVNGNDLPSEFIICGNSLTIQISYAVFNPLPLKNVNFGICFIDSFNRIVSRLETDLLDANFETISGNGSVLCEIERFPLGEGQYHLEVGVSAQNEIYDYIPNAGSITIQQGDFYKTGRLPPSRQRAFFIAHNWRHVDKAKNLNKDNPSVRN